MHIIFNIYIYIDSCFVYMFLFLSFFINMSQRLTSFTVNLCLVLNILIIESTF